jgi:GNAT superfamily N-acetyltransferase
MTAAPRDLDFAMAMKNQAGWNQVVADWHRFIALEPEGCFIAEWDGQPAGTGTVTTYDSQLAWIGMIIVDANHRRLGIGQAIIAACLEFCRRRKIDSVKLDATPAGNALYLKLGFVEELLMDRRQGRGVAMDFDRKLVRPLEPADLDQVIQFDAAGFGVARPGVIERFAGEYPRLAHVACDADGRIVGFLAGRAGASAWQIGPWNAAEPAAAEQLFRAALNNLPGQPIFFDIVAANRSVLPLVSRYGFTHQRPFVRMYLGQNPYPGRLEQVYATSGVEKG